MFFNKKDPNVESPDNYFNPTGNYNQPINTAYQNAYNDSRYYLDNNEII